MISLQNSLRTIAVLTLSATFLLAGCASPQEGHWKMRTSARPGTSATASMEFTRDHTVISDVKTPNGEVKATGIYKINGDKLEINFIETASITPNGTVTTQSSRKEEATVKVQGDTMILAFKRATITLDRIKD